MFPELGNNKRVSIKNNQTMLSTRKRAAEFEIYQDPVEATIFSSTFGLPPAQSTRRASLKWRMIHEKENWDPVLKCFVTDRLSPDKRPVKKKRTGLEVPFMPLADLTEAFGSTYVRFVDVPGESAFALEDTASRASESGETSASIRRSSRILKRRVTGELPSSFIRPSSAEKIDTYRYIQRPHDSQQQQSIKLPKFAIAKMPQQVAQRECGVQEKEKSIGSEEAVEKMDENTGMLEKATVKKTHVNKEDETHEVKLENALTLVENNGQDIQEAFPQSPESHGIEEKQSNVSDEMIKKQNILREVAHVPTTTETTGPPALKEKHRFALLGRNGSTGSTMPRTEIVPTKKTQQLDSYKSTAKAKIVRDDKENAPVRTTGTTTAAMRAAARENDIAKRIFRRNVTATSYDGKRGDLVAGVMARDKMPSMRRFR
ncbi:hypothetical protein BC938DRAFT_480178 [Jimgerdemannia flammicorona]|uniref:Uncharacterized protein n=1 Tax=Jimgerdemannia flammicorona TaxID=994334 RepID=A0A433QJ81_9FUNG|nr:hypothetical protein BC938DRAFT_480178 [Jimgerdemannia flammicorona]